MATDPTKPNPKGHWLKELLLDLTPVLGEIRSGRQAKLDFEEGRPGWGALNLAGMLPLVGTVGKLSKAAKLARAREIVKEIKAAGGITLDLRTGEKIKEGFSAAIPVKGFKPSKELTPEMVLEVLDKAPEGTHLGAWQSGGKWFLEPAEVFPTIEEAAQAGVNRGQIAVGDLARYARGEPGDVLILKHRTAAPLKAGQAFDPKFMGSGMAGAEKARPGRPGAIHFYGMKGKVEDMFTGPGYREVYSFAPVSDFLDLGSDEARKLMKQAGGDADKLERLAIKNGYRGVAEAVDETVKSPYARTYKVFGKSPVLEKGKPAAKVPEAFKEATGAVEAKTRKATGAALPPSGRVIDESGLDKLVVPDVPQVELPSSVRGLKGEPPEEIIPSMEAFRTKYTPLVEQSIKENPRQLMWYLTEPFTRRFTEAGGDSDFFLNAMGPTSAGTNVRKNTELASYYHALKRKGLLSPEMLEGFMEILPGYKHRYQSNVSGQIADVLRGLPFDPKEAQKQARYVSNFFGNWKPFTLDLQVGRVVGVPGLAEKSKVVDGKKVKELVESVGYPQGKGMVGTSPPKKYYGWLEQAGAAEADRLGLPRASYQAAGWPGQDSRPFITILNELIDEGARARGMAPNRFFDELARGNAILGPGAGTFR